MKAVVFHGVGDIRLDEVPEPTIQHPNDAIVRITTSAICGTDLHMVRGTMPGMQEGTVLGHEGVGVVEEVGPNVTNLKPGDRVVIPSTIACGYCSYCRSGYYAQCDNANPNGAQAGTAFYGGPQVTGSFQGLQAEFARVPWANVGLIKLDDEISDDQAILVSDIFPTGYFGAKLAEIKPGDAVAVFGCGPVGQFAIASAKLLDAGRIFAIDNISSRLSMAQAQGAEVINFDEVHPVERIKEFTGGIGVDRAIDAVGVDANHAHSGPALAEYEKNKDQIDQQVQTIVKESHPHGKNWHPGDAPSQALQWAVGALCKAGTLSIIGVYPETDVFFPIGQAMNKNLSLQMGNCNHRRYIPRLLDMVKIGRFDPTKILTQEESIKSAIDAYETFDRRESGWTKVALVM